MEGEKEGDKYLCVCRDLTHDPGTCPDQEPNWQPLTLWDNAYATEPHRSGLQGTPSNNKALAKLKK